MTDPASDRRVLIDADLHLSIDGVDATLVGRGSELTLHTDDPARLSSALRRSGVVSAVRQRGPDVGAQRLVPPGLSLEGPRGRIARIAPDIRGIPLRALPGGTKLRVDRPLDLVPPAVGWAVVAAGLAVALVIRWGRRR